MGILVCPLVSKDTEWECRRERCAWWVPANAYPWPTEGECSVQTIAKGIKTMGDESLIRSIPIMYGAASAGDSPQSRPIRRESTVGKEAGSNRY